MRSLNRRQLPKYDSDLALREGLNARIPEAIKTAVNRYSAIVETVAGSVLDNPLDVEEVVQDTFMKMIGNITSYDAERGRLSTWVCRIAYTTAISFGRRKPKIVSSRLDDMPMDMTSTDYKETDSRIEMLKDALEELAPSDRALLQMVYDASMPLSEVAEILDTNAQALASRLYRLRRKLGKAITEMSNHQRI